jgi:uncharacterized protein with FMN-binding domain
MRNASDSERAEFERVPRRGAVALVATVIGIVLLISFHTPDESAALTTSPAPLGAVGVETPPPTSIPRATPHPSRRPARSAAPSEPPIDQPQATATPVPNAKKVVDGPVVENPYGPVQVEITLQGRNVIDAQALQLPSDRHLSREISNYAGPILRQEALDAQSAHIDIVSGATFTSDAYAQSLQAALDSTRN